MSAGAGFVPCEFGNRVATCFHTPRCGWQVPGDWLSPFGRWAEPVVLTRETEFSGTCACGRECRYRPLPGGYAPRLPTMNVTCGGCGAAVTLAAEPCGHRRGAIDWDTGAWHCYACGQDVDDDNLAEAVADELRALGSVAATVDPQAVAARVRNEMHGG